MSSRPKLKQPTPAELVDDVMGTIRAVYCPDVDAETWHKKNVRLTREWCVLWPAKFIVGKGFTLPADRFKEILLDIITDSKRHCSGGVTYLPAYLGKCVQSHFTKKWHLYYEESKSIMADSTAALMGMKQLPVQDKTVENLAHVARVLAAPKRKAVKTVEAQKELW